MPKRVFIIHGWSGYPEECWFSWLKTELEKKGFKVEVPQMPDADIPKIDTWVPFLSKLVRKPDKDTYFVAHSIGCQTVMRYLQTINAQIGGVVFVAGFFTLKDLETEEEKAIFKQWFERPIDTDKVRKVARKFTCIFSDNDKWVPVENERFFKERLGAKTIMKHNMGHMGGSDNVTEFPDALNELLKLVK